MCKFTYTHLECGHRKQDHIDTSTCKYFSRSGINCQPDNRKHRERGTVVVTREKRGICDKCIEDGENELAEERRQEIWEAKERAAMLKEQREAPEKDRKARQEAERLQKAEADRQAKLKEDQYRADRAEKARLTKENARLVQEAERDAKQREKDELERKHEANERAAAERRRLEEAKRKKKEQARKEQRKREEQEEIERRREEAERQEKADNERLDHLARQQAEAEKIESQRKANFERNEALKREIQADEDRKRQERDAEHAAKLAQNKADDERLQRENEELERKLARQRTTAEQAASTLPIPSIPLTPRTPVDNSKLFGHQLSPELGHFMLGGRRVPLHESQKKPDQTKPPTSPPGFKPAPAPVARLGGVVHSSPNDWKMQQPGIASTPSTPRTPDWQKKLPPRASPKSIPASEEPAMDPVLQRRLDAQRRKCEEDEAEKARTTSNSPSPATTPESETSTFHQKTIEPGWEIIDKTAPAITTPATHTSTSPPPAPPLPPPKTTATTINPAPLPPTKPKPPIKPKFVSSATSPPPPPPMPAHTPTPLPARISSAPMRTRVDSAAPSPLMATRKGDEEGEDGDEEAGSAWDEPDSREMRRLRVEGDRFGRPRRGGWSGE